MAAAAAKSLELHHLARCSAMVLATGARTYALLTLIYSCAQIFLPTDVPCTKGVCMRSRLRLQMCSPRQRLPSFGHFFRATLGSKTFLCYHAALDPACCTNKAHPIHQKIMFSVFLTLLSQNKLHFLSIVTPNKSVARPRELRSFLLQQGQSFLFKTRSWQEPRAGKLPRQRPGRGLSFSSASYLQSLTTKPFFRFRESPYLGAVDNPVAIGHDDLVLADRARHRDAGRLRGRRRAGVLCTYVCHSQPPPPTPRPTDRVRNNNATRV